MNGSRDNYLENRRFPVSYLFLFRIILPHKKIIVYDVLKIVMNMFNSLIDVDNNIITFASSK